MGKTKTIYCYLGGVYDDFGIYETKEDAERGHIPDEQMFEALSDFDGKKVKITVEQLEE